MCWTSSATSPTGVFIVDESGFIKKGVRSAGMARQYTGTSGKIDNWLLNAPGLSTANRISSLNRRRIDDRGLGRSAHFLPCDRCMR